MLLPYRNGEPVLDGFDKPQSIDEIRAVANDFRGNVFAEDSIARNLSWREGVARPQKAEWVEPLMSAEKGVVVPPPDKFDWFWTAVTQLLFLLVPLSVGLQIYAWRKLDGGPGRLARLSGYAMGALWLFVIVTAMAGRRRR